MKQLTIEDLGNRDITRANSKPAEIIQRLLTFGKSQHQIAIRVGRSDSWVSNMITFARKPDEVKESVRQGKTTMAKVIGKKTRQTITKTDIKLICANELIGMTNVDLIVQILKKYFK